MAFYVCTDLSIWVTYLLFPIQDHSRCRSLPKEAPVPQGDEEAPPSPAKCSHDQPEPDVQQCRRYPALPGPPLGDSKEASSRKDQGSPSARRLESFRKAAQFHLNLSPGRSGKPVPLCAPEEDEEEEEVEVCGGKPPSGQPGVPDVSELDDGYVNVIMTASGFQFDTEAEDLNALYSNVMYHKRPSIKDCKDLIEADEPDGHGWLPAMAEEPTTGNTLDPAAALETESGDNMSETTSSTITDTPHRPSSVNSSDDKSYQFCNSQDRLSHQNSLDDSRSTITSGDLPPSGLRSRTSCSLSGLSEVRSSSGDLSRKCGSSMCPFAKRPYSSIPSSPLHGVENPWIPRHRTSNLARRHKTSSLRRSSSLSSLLDSQEVCCEKKKKHADLLAFAKGCNLSISGQKGFSSENQVHRSLPRGTTPPRETRCQASRYATPPRTLMDPKQMRIEGRMYNRSVSSSGLLRNEPLPPCCSPSPGALRKLADNKPPPLMTTSLCEDSADSFQQFVAGLERTDGVSSPPNTSSKSSTLESQKDSLCSESLEEAASEQSSASSPTSTSTNSGHGEGLVDSLKQAMFNLTHSFTHNITHRITGRSPRSLDSSPRHTPRTRSVSALEELHVDPKDKKRHRFVYQLARAYSDRIKGRDKEKLLDSRRKSDKDTPNAVLAHQLASLLTQNKPGSSNLGARIATTKPIFLGTYTLPRHRPPRPKRTSAGLTKPAAQVNPSIPLPSPPDSCQMEYSVTLRPDRDDTLDTDHHDSGVLDLGVNNLNLEDSVELERTKSPPLDTIGVVQLHHAEDLDTESRLYYYENKFMEDLESGLKEEKFRDSGSYCDDDGGGPDLDPTGFKVSIRDTVRLIEQRYQAKHVPKIEIKRVEKPAHGIQEILKNLEACASPEAKDKLTADVPAEKVPFKSIRDRTRELVECATLTRIRQNTSCVDDTHHDVLLEEPEEPAAVEVAVTKSGWVKQVVSQFQHEANQ